MSSSSNLDSLYQQLTTIITPIQIVFGISTNVLNILVLSRRSLLKASPCSYYFLGIAVASLLAIIIGPGITFIQNYSTFSPYSTSIGCKLLPYLITLLTFYISAFVVLATIDRFCYSSALNWIRRWSSTRLTRRAVLIVVVLFAGLLIPTLFIWYINDDFGGVCLPYTSGVATTYVIVQTVAAACLPPLTMIIFGILTIYNIHAQRNRVIPAPAITRQRRTEIQLVRMLLWQVLTYLILYMPIGVTYTSAVINSNMQIALLDSIINLCSLWNHFFYMTPFFLYILTARIYRRALLRLICCRNRRNNNSQASVHVINVMPLNTQVRRTNI